MNYRASHSPHWKSKTLKGGIHFMQRALSHDELDAQVRRDTEEVEKHAAERIENAKKDCEVRRKRKELQHKNPAES